ncbi:unnamed protein product [Lathyrus sativus]|nr:unnamed protein product [Lathyrus sativus]
MMEEPIRFLSSFTVRLFFFPHSLLLQTHDATLRRESSATVFAQPPYDLYDDRGDIVFLDGLVCISPCKLYYVHVEKPLAFQMNVSHYCKLYYAGVRLCCGGTKHWC